MAIGRRYHGNDDEAGGAVNGAFLKILDNLDKYGPEVPFEAWIRRIMINSLVDEYRRNRKVRELVEYRDLESVPPTVSPIDFNLADLKFGAEQLELMIQRLPPVSRKVFNLHAIDGYSHVEIGNLLDISEGTSKWHLSFARKKLQEMIKESLSSSKKVIG